MADEKKEVVDTSQEKPNDMPQGAEKETPQSAPKMDEPDKEPMQKPPKSTEYTQISGEEVKPDELLEKVNEILAEAYDGQSIESLQEELRPLMSDLMNASIALKSLQSSTIWGAVLDDLMDQAEDGQTPNPDLALVRAAPKDYIDRLYEGSDDEAVVKAIDERNASIKAEEEAGATLSSNIEQSIKEAEEFSNERGYSEEEKQAFLNQVKMWYKVFADGKITKNEYELIEKGMNYDNDVAGLKSQVPEEPKKEVLPDKSSIDSSKIEMPKPRSPLGMESIAYEGTDITQIGSRKRKAGKY